MCWSRRVRAAQKAMLTTLSTLQTAPRATPQSYHVRVRQALLGATNLHGDCMPLVQAYTGTPMWRILVSQDTHRYDWFTLRDGKQWQLSADVHAITTVTAAAASTMTLLHTDSNCRKRVVLREGTNKLVHPCSDSELCNPTLSDDGTQVVGIAADANNTTAFLRHWDVKTNIVCDYLLPALPTLGIPCICIPALCPDGHTVHLLVPGHKWMLVTFDMRVPHVHKWHELAQSDNTSVEFSRDKQWLYAVQRRRSWSRERGYVDTFHFVYWSTNTGEFFCPEQVRFCDTVKTPSQLSPSGRRLVALEERPVSCQVQLDVVPGLLTTVTVYEWDTFRVLYREELFTVKPYTIARFSLDDTELLLMQQCGRVMHWDLVHNTWSTSTLRGDTATKSEWYRMVEQVIE